jgi:clan AA aspartic protease (TIGR02281 family)
MNKLIYVTLLFLSITLTYGQKIIKLNKEYGVYTLPCEVNGVKMKFIYDTGASQVSISIAEAIFLSKNGLIGDKDIIGTSSFQDATGNISEGKIINLRQLNIDGIILNNVKATVVNNIKAPLLLGQNVLARLGRITFNPANSSLELLDYASSLKIVDYGTEEGRSYCNNGSNKQNLEDYEGALVDYNIAIKINPNYFEGYFLRGTLKAVLGDHKGAIIDFSTAIKLNSKYTLSFTNRAWSKEELQDYKGAIIDYTEVINSQDVDAINYFCRGNAKKQLGDQLGAIYDYNKAIKIDSGFADAYFNSGHSKMILKDYKGALIDFDKGIEINPQDALAYYNRGQVKMAINLKASACSDWEKASELGFEEVDEDIQNYCK